MKQLITLFAVLAGTAALFAAKPEFKDNTLVCGNKKLTFAKNGNITAESFPESDRFSSTETYLQMFRPY